MSVPVTAYALRRLRRGWRSGELLILMLALMVSVAAATAVGQFSDRLRSSIARQSGDVLAADAVIRSRDPLPAVWPERATAQGLRLAHSVEFPTIAVHRADTALVSLKAVSGGYPLRGSVRLAEQPFGPVRIESKAPAPGEVWVDTRLWQALSLTPGASLGLGRAQFRVAAVLEFEPDRGGGFSDLAPRLMMNWQDLAATGLLTDGSRAQYGLMLRGSAAAIDALDAQPLPEGARLLRPSDARPEIAGALNQANRFLDIAVLAVALLSGAAIALCAQLHGQRMRDEVALLKCLGADRRFLRRSLLMHLLLLGVAAGLPGAVLGWLAQQALSGLLGGLMQASLPRVPPVAALNAWAMGLLMLLGFGLPPLLAALRTPPIHVFQRVVDARASRWATVAAVTCAALLLWWRAGDGRLALYVLGGAGLCCAALAVLAAALVWALAPLRSRGGMLLRFGLGNIARRRGAVIAQTVALGLALLALLLVGVVRGDLLSAWQDRLPADAPNQFLINIQPEQLQPLQEFFAQRGHAELQLWPMVRARLTELRGDAVTADSFDDPETQRWINREFNLTWTERFGPDNTLIEGSWWPPQTRGEPWLSVDEYAVERLALKIGDRLRLQVADRELELTVYNVRKVDWDSMRPNFFLAVPPGVLDELPAQWLTSFYLPPQDRQLLRELVVAFPNVTPLDIDAVMTQLRSISERIGNALGLVLLFTLAAGLTVLLAAIEATRNERAREAAVLRVLGARSRLIVGAVLVEYAAIGLLAGVVASAGAQLVASVLAARVLGLEYGLSAALWLIGTALGASLVCGLAWWSLRSSLRTSSQQALARLSTGL